MSASSSEEATGKMLVHGLWFRGAPHSLAARRARFQAAQRVLGLASYEMIDSRRHSVGSALLRRARGTCAPPDAVEIMHLSAGAPQVSAVADLWASTAACALDGLDVERSFVLSGTPRRRLTGQGGAFRVLWLGRGMASLSEDEFASHYLDVHGNLVEGHATLIGLRRYTQLRAAFDDERQALIDAGLGKAAPTVFAELVLGFGTAALLRRREQQRALAEIAADEGRHIDFSRSMILLA